jgi:hypothetical protein
MEQTRVAALHYGFVSLNAHDRFERAAAWRGELGAWKCELLDGRLQAAAGRGRGFLDVAAARQDLDLLLRDWETFAFLDDQYRVAFIFERAAVTMGDNEVEQGAPDPRPPTEDDAIYRRDNDRYPAPDTSFSRTALVVELLDDIWRFRRGDAALPSVARSLLGKLADAAPGHDVSAAWNIEVRVAETVTELVSRSDGPLNAGQAVAAYRGPEWQWLQEALRRLTIQAGRGRSGLPARALTLDDFSARL